jgi:hypothetical protein
VNAPLGRANKEMTVHPVHLPDGPGPRHAAWRSQPPGSCLSASRGANRLEHIGCLHAPTGRYPCVMKLQVVFTRDELVAFAGQWLPLKLLLGDASKEDRFLALSDPTTIDLVPDAGLRIACRAQIRYPVLGLTVPVTARHVSVLFSPSVALQDGLPALAFQLKIEQAELSGIPARLNATITDAVNRALSERVKPSWPFGRSLTRSIAMPALLATTQSIDLSVRSGSVHVSDEAFTFELSVHADATRRTAATPAE